MARKKAVDPGIIASGSFGKNEPTAGDVDGMWRYKLSQYEELGLRQFLMSVRPQTDMRHGVFIPKEYKQTAKEVRTPYMRDAMVRIASAMVRDTPIPRVPPINHSEDADEAGDIVSRWLHKVWKAMIKENRGQDLFYLSSRSLTRDSESVIKVVDRTQAWANFPARDPGEEPGKYLKRMEDAKKKRGVVLPFAACEVDRARMVFDDGEYGDRWAIEYGVYPAAQIIAEYGKGSVPTTDDYMLPRYKLGGKPVPMGYNSTVTSVGPDSCIKLEYMDEDWWAVVVNGTMVPGWPKPNPYAPFIPWFRAVAEPALYSLRYYQPAIDSLLTGKMNWAFLSMYPLISFEPVSSNQMPGAIDLPTGDESTPPVGMRWRPGMAMQPPPGYKVVFQELPSSGKDVDQLIDIFRGLIDIAGIPSIFRGVGGARQAGYAINQLMAAANTQYKNMGQSLSHQFERASEFILWTVKHVIGEELAPVWCGDLAVKPTGSVSENIAPLDLVGAVEFTFKPVIPSDEQATEMIGLQALAARAISHETFLRDFMNLSDPQGEMDRIAVEQEIAQNPELHEMMIDDAFRKAGIVRPAPPPMPGMEGQPGMPGMDGRTAAGQPPGISGGPGALQEMIRPRQPAPTPEIHPGGRPPGAYPGQPGGPNKQGQAA